MTPEQASFAINKRWAVRWPAELTATGQTYVDYSLDNIVKDDAIYFARVSMVNLNAEQLTLGPAGKRKWSRTGNIEVRLNGELNQGRKRLDQLAKLVMNIFQGKRVGKLVRDGGVVTYATAIGELQRDQESPRLWLIICSTPFSYIDIS